VSGFICGVNEVFAIVGFFTALIVSYQCLGKSVGPEVTVTNH